MAAYVAAKGGKVPDGHHVTASRLTDLEHVLSDEDPDRCLWGVAFMPDDRDAILVGGTTTIVGPDGKVFQFSHPLFAGRDDLELVLFALTWIYVEEVADLVDPCAFSEVMEGIVIEKDRAIFAIPDTARRGELSRAVWDRARPQCDVLVIDAVDELSFRGPGMNVPLRDRLAARHPATSLGQLEEAIHQATLIGLHALELTQHPHDRSQVLEELERNYPSVYPRIWPKIYLRAIYWWQWEL